MSAERFDIVIIGTGAGGGTMARALAETGAEILLVERGDFVPQEPENSDPGAVWKALRYRATDRWVDQDGQSFVPYTHYCVGGNTKFWGSVLYRLRREDFGELAHLDGVSPAWPIDYDTLAPYYDRAERLYQVHGTEGADPTDPPRGPFPYTAVPHAARMSDVIERLHRFGLHPSPLPLGLLGVGEPGGCILCNTCNSFPCRFLAKSEADVCCVRPASSRPNVTLWTNAVARRIVTDASGRNGCRGRNRSRGHGRPRGGAALRHLMRRGQLCGAHAPLGERASSRRAGQFIGPRRPPLHGAPGDDAAGRVVAAEPRRVPEDGGDQRLLLRRTRFAVPAGPHPVAGPYSRRDGEDGGGHLELVRHRVAHPPALDVRGVGVARRRLARDDRRPAVRRQPRDARA